MYNVEILCIWITSIIHLNLFMTNILKKRKLFHRIMTKHICLVRDSFFNCLLLKTLKNIETKNVGLSFFSIIKFGIYRKQCNALIGIVMSSKIWQQCPHYCGMTLRDFQIWRLGDCQFRTRAPTASELSIYPR